jgi:Protein of unknown function (DUF4019)
MKTQTPKTLLAILALALGVAGQAAAQAPRVDRRPPASRTQKPSSVKVLETDAPAEETPTTEATEAQTQTPPPSTGSTMAPGATAPGTMAPTAPSATGTQVREEMAVTGVRDWLALVDSGRFPDAYDQAGELFRGSMAREQWAAALGNSRKPLGNVLQRNLKTAVVAQDLPGAPKGKYVVSTFETTFQQQAAPLWEIATSFLGPDGSWKVVGYQTKPQDTAAAKPPAK